MVVFTSKLSDPDDVKKAIFADVEMTHSNPLVKEAIWIYTVVIHHLLNNPDTPDRAEAAFELALRLSQKGTEMPDLIGVKQSVGKWLMLAAELSDMTDAKQALLLERIPADKLNCRELIGWLQRAFVLSFYFLKRYKGYKLTNNNNLFFDAVRLTIQEGGDTDTNACIVGGMIGALVGYTGLPNDMVMKVVNFDCNTVLPDSNLG